MSLLLVTAGILFPVSASAQVETRSTHLEPEPRQIRCGDYVQTFRKPLLALTKDQCLLIGRETPVLPEHVSGKSRLSAPEAMRLNEGLGHPPPAGISLLTLPAKVTRTYPDLARYRYFIREDDIALVDPKGNVVVALVEVHVRPGVGR
ncbi:MAG: hypothetical protein R3D44_13940 [Hyphomicrobiaceae bacterium]